MATLLQLCCWRAHGWLLLWLPCLLRLQMVPAVVGAYQCNGTVDWLEEEHPYYPPTVNDPGAAEFAKGVVGQLLGRSNVSDSIC